MPPNVSSMVFSVRGGLSLPAGGASDCAMTVFQSRAWLDAWTKAYAPASDGLFTALIQDSADGIPCLALPLVRERRGCLRVLTMPDRGVSDYLAPWLRPDYAPSPEVFADHWRQLVAALPKADLLALDKMPAMVGGRANPLAGLARVRPAGINRHPLPLDRPYEEIVAARFDGSCMRSLDKKRRKLERKGELVFTPWTADAPATLLDEILAWREHRFEDRNAPEKLARDAHFYRTLFRQTDVGRMMTLTLDGKLIAGCYGTEANGAIQLLGVAYDEAWKNWSPGLLVMCDAVRWASERGLGEFDFTIGDESYKLNFGVDDEPLYRLCEPLTLMGRICGLFQRLKARARCVWHRLRRR